MDAQAVEICTEWVKDGKVWVAAPRTSAAEQRGG
jgi:hypothetical protein